MNRKQREQLQAYAHVGDKIDDSASAYRWVGRVERFLETSLGKEAANKFRSLQVTNEYDSVASMLGHLEGLLASSEDTETDAVDPLPTAGTQASTPNVNRQTVFIVHGHDGEAKETVARFLEKLELEPINSMRNRIKVAP